MMTPEQFCYWLQGFSELRVGTTGPTDGQWKAIVDHLQTVFNKVTPPVVPPAFVTPVTPDVFEWPHSKTGIIC